LGTVSSRAGACLLALVGLGAVEAGTAAADEGPGPLPPPIVRPVRRPTPSPAPGPALPGAFPAPAPDGAAEDGPPERPGTPSDDEGAPELPTAPPPRPAGAPEPKPGDFVFEIERPGGLLHRMDEEPGVAILGMIGNPRLHATAYVRKDGGRVPDVSIKANTIVVAVDLEKVPSLESFQGLGIGAPSDEAKPKKQERPASPASLFQEAVLWIYAEGAAELEFGDVVFRADRLYLEPRTYRGLLVEPRLTAHVQGRDLVPGQRLPVHVRARRGRMVAKGLTVFDDADLTTSLADDRIELRVRRVTVEDYAEAEEAAAAADESNLLGYRSFRTQRLRVESVVTRAERVPIFYWPNATLGPAGGESFPVRIRRLKAGRRTSLGWYGILGVGGDLGPEDDPLAEWMVILSGYTKRGPAGGLELEWNRRGVTGQLVTWGIYDNDPEDRNGFVAPAPFRWRTLFENRWAIARDWTLDTEFAQFSDAGVNREYFEREDLEHKDYETYGRLLWTPGNAAFTLVGKAHVRDFVTETTEEPQASAWIASVPIVEPAHRGGLAFDVTSVSKAGRMARRFADGVLQSDYEAVRLATATLVHGAVDVADVRLTGWAGPSAAWYGERTDGGPDVTRAALLAGVRANLQMWRVYPAQGGPFRLDGLRHVVDWDLLYGGRYFDTRDVDEVPFFDRVEQDEVSAGILRVRNRLQTHDRGGAIRPVLDLEVAGKWFPDGRNAYGVETPAEIDFVLRSNPRPDVYVGGEGTFDVGDGRFRDGWLGVGTRPADNLAFFTGIRWVQDAYFAPVLDLWWRWSEKYGLRFYESYDFRGDENTMRLVFRRYSLDHVLEFGFTAVDADDVSLELSVAPAIGGRPPDWSGLREQPDLDPWRAFPGARP
jgi:hypothetical protein